MRLVFRADASSEMGAGHIMRCSAIAEEALSRGISCVLVGSLGGILWLEKRLLEIGLEIQNIEHFNQSRVTNGDVLIIDSYSHLNIVRFIESHEWSRVVSIIDETSPIIESSLFIHPGLDDSWFVGNRDKFLSGAKYIPLRRTIKKTQRVNIGSVQTIVVFGGGTDVFHFAHSIAEKLVAMPGFERVIFFAEDTFGLELLDSRFHFLHFGDSLDQVIESADLVLTTASTSSLEMLAREVHLGVACAVGNQKAYYDALEKTCAVGMLGKRSDSGNWNLDENELRKLILDQNYRKKLRLNSYGLIDLSGAKRIVDAISTLVSRGEKV